MASYEYGEGMARGGNGHRRSRRAVSIPLCRDLQTTNLNAPESNSATLRSVPLYTKSVLHKLRVLRVASITSKNGIGGHGGRLRSRDLHSGRKWVWRVLPRRARAGRPLRWAPRPSAGSATHSSRRSRLPRPRPAAAQPASRLNRFAAPPRRKPNAGWRSPSPIRRSSPRSPALPPTTQDAGLVPLGGTSPPRQGVRTLSPSDIDCCPKLARRTIRILRKWPISRRFVPSTLHRAAPRWPAVFPVLASA